MTATSPTTVGQFHEDGIGYKHDGNHAIYFGETSQVRVQRELIGNEKQRDIGI